MLKVALTGGIASGKSTVADLFRQRNIEVIDTDDLAREVVAIGQPALAEIADQFGPEFLQEDGSLNRRKLRETIFSNVANRERLNAILHPRIMQRLEQQLRELKDTPYVIIEVPLLVEGGFEKDFDRVLVIDTPASIQINRLMERDGMTDRESAKQTVQAQADRNERLAVADDIIVNDGPPEALAAEVDKLDQRYREFASTTGTASE